MQCYLDHLLVLQFLAFNKEVFSEKVFNKKNIVFCCVRIIIHGVDTLVPGSADYVILAS